MSYVIGSAKCRVSKGITVVPHIVLPHSSHLARKISLFDTRHFPLFGSQILVLFVLGSIQSVERAFDTASTLFFLTPWRPVASRLLTGLVAQHGVEGEAQPWTSFQVVGVSTGNNLPQIGSGWFKSGGLPDWTCYRK